MVADHVVGLTYPQFINYSHYTHNSSILVRLIYPLRITAMFWFPLVVLGCSFKVIHQNEN